MLAKLAAAAVAFAAVANGAVVTNDLQEAQHRFLFAKHQAQFGLEFQPEEVEYRFTVFRQNLAHVEKHNAEYEAGNHTHWLEMNEFAHMTNSEFSAYMKGYRRREVPRDSKAHLGEFEHDGAAVEGTIDWRTKGVVAPVENQGQCGSCWSFSAAGAITGLNAYKTGNLVQVSEQEFVDCVNGGADTCQVGGEMTQAFEFAINKGGVEPESDYPYCACSGNQCKFDQSDATIDVVKGYKNVPQGDENALYAALMEQPTISIAVNAAGMNWQLYGGGVMSSSCPGSPSDLDHGVLLVGVTEDAALVKNSWGASWGESGFISLKKGIDQCGLAQDASFPTA